MASKLIPSMAQLVGDTSRESTPKPHSAQLRKRKSTLQRLSSFFPSLINSHHTDQLPEHPHRKSLPPDSHAEEPHSHDHDNTSSPLFDFKFDLNNSENKTAPVPGGKDWFAPPTDPPPPPPKVPIMEEPQPQQKQQQQQQQQHGRDSSDGSAPTSPSSTGKPTGKLHKKPPALAEPLVSPSPDGSPQRTPEAGATFDLPEPNPSLRIIKDSPHRRSRSSSVTAMNLKPGEPKGRSVSAQPPPNRVDSAPAHIVVTGTGDRPGSSSGNLSPNKETERRGRLRRSWLPGARSRSHSRDVTKAKNGAWILGQNQDYNTTFLINAERVPELWNESGTVYVYLHPKGTGTEPSFKVPSFAVDYSLVFNELIDAEMSSPTGSERSRARSFTGRDSLSVDDASRKQTQSPSLSLSDFSAGESRLYLPVSMSDPGQATDQDLQRLISIRNMFAFLTGQPLVATDAQPTLFKVMSNVAKMLKEFDFTNADGSTFGDSVDMSFSFLMEQMTLADVRTSREKTLESLILGEQMRSITLYQEAFAHAAGKYSAIRDLKSPLWEQVSPITRQRLERAHLDLVTRQDSVNSRIEAFEFPALFSGIGSSTTTYKDVKFHVWRRSFNRMKQFVLNYYKTSFGNWPPKARSKKNPFTESGLNRLVLKILYSDLSALYDLIVDRENITTRVIDMNADEIAHDSVNPHVSALRGILTEFDNSSPPVLPPIPFDLPMLPNMASIKENYYELPVKEQVRLGKDLQDYQLLLILNKAYDFETFKLPMPFLGAFKEFEHKEAKGKMVPEIADQRIGYWLFLYVVIQTLPMLVVDAPALQYMDGVEYFLCQPAKGNPPWMGDGGSLRKRWYEVAGGGGLVELSEDAVEFGIEGIYNRSHCWLAAKQWELAREGGGALGDPQQPPPPQQETASDFQAPQSAFQDMDPRRSVSPPTGPPSAALRPPRTDSPGLSPGGADRSQYRKSIVLGLEPIALPLDGSGMPGGGRVVSARGPSPSPGARPVSTMMHRSRSSGNLHDPSAGAGSSGPSTTTPPVPGQADAARHGSVVGGSTFDDILKDIDQKPKKKKGFF